MSRPDSPRSAFVGAAWFAVLMTVCVVALGPATRGRAKPSRAVAGKTDAPQRVRSQRPPIVDRPAWPELHGANAPARPLDDSEPRLTPAQPLVTAKPVVPGGTPPGDTPIAPRGPALPAPRIPQSRSAIDRPVPLRGLEVPVPLTVDVLPPVSAVEGEVAPFVIRVRNSTASDAEGVIIAVRFDESWELPGSEDLSVEQRLGIVAAGETRELTIGLLPLRSGQLSADFQLSSDSHPPQRVAAGAEVDPRVVELALAGPRRRSPGQRAEFLLTVRNTTSHDLPESRVAVEFDPATLAVREASVGSEAGTGSLAWPLGALLKGERVQIQIEYECLSESLRSPVSAAFTSEGRTLRACGNSIEVVPVAPFDISIVDADDPWTVGTEAKFAIRIRNRTQAAITDVALRLSASPHFQQVSVEPASAAVQANVTGDAFGAEVQLPNLPAGEEIELQATTHCALPGDGVFRVLVQSKALAAPFEVEESAVVNGQASAP